MQNKCQSRPNLGLIWPLEAIKAQGRPHTPGTYLIPPKTANLGVFPGSKLRGIETGVYWDLLGPNPGEKPQGNVGVVFRPLVVRDKLG